MKKYIVSAILAIAAFAANSAEPVFYEASLTDNYGTPSKAENVAIRFTLLDAAGNVLYAETTDAVTDGNGHIFTPVGCGVPLEGSFTEEAWETAATLGITITRADGSEISDNATLTYSPAASHADVASALVSPVKDGGRYVMTVDDSGNLSTAREDFNIIPVPAGYTRLIFHDEFDYAGLPNPEYWDYEEGYVRNGELQYYTRERIENAEVADGLLHLRCLNDKNYPDPEKGGMCEYTSGSIHTKDKVKFTYGRVDVRAKLSNVKGTWPAIWLFPNDGVYGAWPRSGEIDIMEHVGYNPNVVYFTAHTWQHNGGNDNKHHNSMTLQYPTTPYDDFHIYSIEWTPNKLTWYVDGKRGYSMVRSTATWIDWPFDQDFYIILNLAWGGGWGGREGIDAARLPVDYQVDYVRVFQ